MKIDINQILLPLLEKISMENGLTPEKYAGNIVQSFLENQYRGSVMDKIKDAQIEELRIVKDNKLNDLIKK